MSKSAAFARSRRVCTRPRARSSSCSSAPSTRYGRAWRAPMPEYTGMDWLERALADLPRREFKLRLKADLERSAAMITVETPPRVWQDAVPQLRVTNTAAAIDFYTRAFDAREVMRFAAGGRIPQAEPMIGGSLVLLRDEGPEERYTRPPRLGGPPGPLGVRVGAPPTGGPPSPRQRCAAAPG